MALDAFRDRNSLAMRFFYARTLGRLSASSFSIFLAISKIVIVLCYPALCLINSTKLRFLWETLDTESCTEGKIIFECFISELKYGGLIHLTL